MIEDSERANANGEICTYGYSSISSTFRMDIALNENMYNNLSDTRSPRSKGYNGSVSTYAVHPDKQNSNERIVKWRHLANAA